MENLIYKRKLASIQQIADVQPIDGADAIVKVRVNDWWCVAKKGEFKVGDLAVYHEIDCLLPMNETYEFLASRGTKKSELEDGTIVEGYRLRTIKLRGQLSQGLALPWTAFPSVFSRYDDTVSADGKIIQRQHPLTLKINTPDGITFIGPSYDVTELLGIHKYERPMNAQLRGTARGNFPSFARKSDQERCQNIRREIWDAYVAGDEFQVTVKLDGSSMTTFFIDEEMAEKYGTESRFGVCSRNLELKETEGNAFWEVARRDGLEEILSNPVLKNLVVQGELISPNIQGNFEGVNRPDFYVYNMFDIDEQEWIEPNVTAELLRGIEGLRHVPVMHGCVTLSQLFPNATQDTIVQDLLDYADGPSAFGGKLREGVVFKRVDGKFSFKAISNRYLIKAED